MRLSNIYSRKEKPGMMLELRTNIFWIVADVTAYYVKCKFFGEMIINISQCVEHQTGRYIIIVFDF